MLSSILVIPDAGWSHSHAQLEQCQCFMGDAHPVTVCNTLYIL